MSRRAKKKEDYDEVEEILQAAEAMMLLRLTTDTHLARGSTLSADLDRRLNALKAPPPAPEPAAGATKISGAGSKAVPDEEMKRILGGDLSARFAALKVTTNSSPSVGGSSNSIAVDPARAEDGGSSGDEGEDGVSTKEVEKLLQWAKDAARLDPSPPSDDEDADQVHVKDEYDEWEERKKKVEKKKMRLWI